MNDATNQAQMPPKQLVAFKDGHVEVDWELAERLSKAFDLGVHDHPGCAFAKVFVSIRDDALHGPLAVGAAPRVPFDGPPAEIGDNMAWRAQAFDQIEMATREVQNKAVVGMAVVLMRIQDGQLASLPMWSTAIQNRAIIHAALVEAAQDILNGFNSTTGEPVGSPIRPLN